MKFRCERDLLVEALGTTGRAVAARGALPVLSGIRLCLEAGQLQLTATDLELTISVTISVAGGGDGVAVLPGRIAADMVRSLPPGEVVVEVDGDEAHVSAQRFTSSLRLLPAEEYPRTSEPEGDPISLTGGALAGAVRQVLPAAGRDDSRPILTGILLAAEADGIRLVATDSYRLAVRDLPGTSVLREDQKVLVPSRALRELERAMESAGDLSLWLGEREATVVVEHDGVETRLTTRLIEGEFPNYRGLIPASHPNRLTVAREAFLEALRRVKLLAQQATPVRLLMSADGLELVAITQDVGEAREQVDATYTGTDLEVAFNPEYLISGVEVIAGDEVNLDTVDAQKPAVLRGSDGEEFLYLLMPVRVS